GHGEILQAIDHHLEGAARGLPGVARAAFGDRVEIGAGGVGAPGAGDDQHPDRGIALHAIEQLDQRLQILRLDAVHMARTVETDGGARALDGEDRRARRLGRLHLPEHHLFSSVRRLASASMVSARSGWRAINRRKSTRSSTRSLDSRVVVMLAERKVLPSSAISPKNAPSPSRTFLPRGRSTSTSPVAMKYMQSPCWPLRMIVTRGGRSMVRSMLVTSAIADGPSVAKNGTLLTDSQVLRKLSRRVSAANPVARIPVHRPNTPSPEIITSAAKKRPIGVIGTTSP